MAEKFKAPPVPVNDDSNITQAQRFKQVARELETDNDEKRFDETLKKLAAQKPKYESAK